MEVITTHVNADFDAMASMVAAKRLYPDALLVFSGSQERSLREFFIKSTLYLYNFRRLRDIDIEDVSRLILVDTRQASRIAKFEQIVNRSDVEVHIYDHHPDSPDDISGDQEIVRPVGATVTILTQLIRERGIEITPEEATIMSLGIFEDTGSFTFNSTTAEDFEAAAYLRRSGADLNVVSDMVTQELTAEQVSLLNELLHSAQNFNVNGIEICIATVSVDNYVGDFALLVHKLKDINNLDVVFALARMEDRIYLVARSRMPHVNAGAIARQFGGGGHATAASATIRDLTLIQVEERLREILSTTVKVFPTAGELMSSPVVFAHVAMPIHEAEQIMVRYNINSMPVLQGGELAGLITRQVLEKAIYHKLEGQAVGEFMTSDFSVVQPHAGLLEIQTYLVEHQQRILPVVEGDRVLGVITRKDLLNFLVNDQDARKDTHFQEMGNSRWPKRKNISGIVREQLEEGILDVLKDLGSFAQLMGFKAYVIGGFVRDLLLRRPNLDIDIVIEGDGLEFAKAYAEQRGIRARCHRKFNTAVLVFSERLKVDVASARFEYYQHPGALPVVEASSLRMDLYRRDFTINTLALSINPGDFGHLIDFFGGQRDIKEKTIRVLHNLSFVEDPTRIMRAIRFEQRFGFRIGKQTANLMRGAVKMGLVHKLGGKRFFHEIQLILMEENPLPALQRMAEYGVLSVLSSNLQVDSKRRDLFISIGNVISWYRLSFLDEPLETWRVYALGLFCDLPRDDLDSIWERLDFPPTQSRRMLWTFRRVDKLLRGFFQLPDHRPSDIYRALQEFNPEEILFIMAKAPGEKVRRAISHYLHRYRNVRTELRGRDLKAMGVPPGPIYRTLLDQLLDAQLNGEVKSRQEELALLFRSHPELFKEEKDAAQRGAMGSS